MDAMAEAGKQTAVLRSSSQSDEPCKPPEGLNAVELRKWKRRERKRLQSEAFNAGRTEAATQPEPNVDHKTGDVDAGIPVPGPTLGGQEAPAAAGANASADAIVGDNKLVPPAGLTPLETVRWKRAEKKRLKALEAEAST